MTVLANDLALALDPSLLLARYGLQPDPWQSDLLRSGAKQMALLCARQVGKSLAAATLALHEALYGPPAPTLILSPSLRQSKELHRKIRAGLAAVGEHAGEIETESSLELELRRGARICCLPGKESTVRGYSGVRLLVVDEASLVSDDLYQSIRPMVAVSGGRLIALSTPRGQRGWFHHEWTEGGPDWKRVSVDAFHCPRMDTEWLKLERARIGDFWFRQEYLCEFLQGQDALFAYADVIAALDDEVQPLFAQPAHASGAVDAYVF